MREQARAGIGIALSVALFVAIAVGREALLALMIVLGVLAAGDVFRRARARGATPIATVGLGGVVAAMVVAHARGADAADVLPAVVALVFGVACVVALLRHRRARITEGVAYTMLAVAMVGLFGAHVLLLRAEAEGFRLVLGFAVLVVAAEVASTIAPLVLRTAQPARALRFAVSVSASLIAAAVVSATLGDPFPIGRALLLGLLVAIAVPAGDTFGDMVERDLPTGRDQGARAGLLASLDGSLLAAPIFYYAFRALAR